MRRIRLFLVFAAGAASGLALAWGWSVLAGRAGSAPGGEMLLVPLMSLLVWLGYNLRSLTATDRDPVCRVAQKPERRPEGDRKKKAYDWSEGA